MGDIYLDEATGDIAFINKTPVLITDNGKAVRQRLYIRLNTAQGEWFYNSEKGVPYFQDIFGTRGSQGLIESILRSEIIETEGVLEILSFSSSFNYSDRKLNIETTVSTREGDIVSVSV